MSKQYITCWNLEPGKLYFCIYDSQYSVYFYNEDRTFGKIITEKDAVMFIGRTADSYRLKFLTGKQILYFSIPTNNIYTLRFCEVTI